MRRTNHAVPLLVELIVACGELVTLRWLILHFFFCFIFFHVLILLCSHGILNAVRPFVIFFFRCGKMRFFHFIFLFRVSVNGNCSGWNIITADIFGVIRKSLVVKVLYDLFVICFSVDSRAGNVQNVHFILEFVFVFNIKRFTFLIFICDLRFCRNIFVRARLL